jgi:hypothetical protein
VLVTREKELMERGKDISKIVPCSSGNLTCCGDSYAHKWKREAEIMAQSPPCDRER